MSPARRQRIFAFWLSVLFHALIVVALTFSIPLSFTERSAGPVIIPIESVMIDETALNAEIARIEEAKQAEIRRQQEAERRQREEVQRQQREEQQRQERIVQEQRDREAAAREAILLEAQRVQREAEEAAQAAADAERLRQEQLAREREEAERQRRAAAEAAQRRSVQDEIARAAAAEAEGRAAANAGLRDQWAAAIARHVERRWQRPPNATSQLSCLLIVNQLPDGSVVSSTVSECNTTDENIIRSLENAVQNSSPLPTRPPGVEFERVLRIRFKPME